MTFLLTNLAYRVIIFKKERLLFFEVVMQVKKDEVRERLLYAGCDEFLKKGFEKASIRSIVNLANTNIGNFYNYFESKSALFSALVEGIYDTFTHMMTEHHNMQMGDELNITVDTKLWRKQLEIGISSILPIMNERFVLLMSKSEGTKYAGVKEQLVDMLSEHFIEHIDETAPHYQHRKITRIISTQFVDGITSIISLTKSEHKRKQLIIELVLYTATGIFALLQGE